MLQTSAIARVAREFLRSNPANARQHVDRNLATIRGFLASSGQLEPLVVHKPKRQVIGGSVRLDAGTAMGV
jgi:hypothetical protein